MNLPDTLRTLNPKAAVPLYLQLKDALLQVLQSGEWSENKSLPSERELSQGLKVSRATVRQAIHELELEGWLERKQGRGTFPTPAKVEQPLARITGFSENMRQSGIEPSTRLLSAKLAPAPSIIAKAMRLKPGSVVAVITRLRLADAQPLMLERAYINYALTPGLLQQDLKASLYDILTRTYRLKFARGNETIQATTADVWLAKALNIPKGSVVLYTERTVISDNGMVLEHTERFGRADKCSFRVNLEGDNTQIALKETP